MKGESELRARLRAFAFDHSSVMPPACDVSSGIFTGISEKGLDLQRAVQHVRCFTPEGTLKTQRNAVRRLMELLDFIPELNAEALKDPLRAGDLMEAFFVARAGIPTQRPHSPYRGLSHLECTGTRRSFEAKLAVSQRSSKEAGNFSVKKDNLT